MSWNLDSDICHLAFPFSLVSSVMSEPVSQPDPHPTAYCHVDSGQEDTAKDMPTQAHTLLSCEEGQGGDTSETPTGLLP